MSDEKNSEMVSKLEAAGKKVEVQKTQRRERVVRGSHLVEDLTSRARSAGLTLQEKSGFLKVTGSVKGRSIYVAKKGGRVDFSGFAVDSPAVTTITEEEARQKHLGKVRGQLNFNQPDDLVVDAYKFALTQLDE